MAEEELEYPVEEENQSSSQSVLLRDRIANQLPYKWMKELWEILVLSIASTLLFLFLYTLQTEPMMLSGHLSLEELNAVALSCTFITSIAVSISVGTSTAATTYFSQSYGGAQYRTIDVFFQTSLIAMTTTSLLVVCLFLHIRLILLPLKQNPVVSEMAARYMMLVTIGIPFDFCFYALTVFMFSQKRLLQPLVAAFLGNMLNVVSQYLAIYVFGCRYLASAVARSGSVACMTLTLAVSIAYEKRRTGQWDGWSLRALDFVPAFYKLALPACVTFLAVYGSLEVGVFVLGTVSKEDMAAYAIILTCSSFMVLNRVGIQEAMSIRIGHLVGSGDINQAKYSVKVAVVFSTITAVLSSLLYVILRWELPKLFTDDHRVVSLVAEGFLYFMLYPVVNSLATAANGVLRGCAKQPLTGPIAVMSLLVFSIPIGVPLALLTDLRTGGVWLGNTSGITTLACCYFIVIFTLDWEKETRLAKERCKKVGEKQLETTSSSEASKLLDDSKGDRGKARIFSVVIIVVVLVLLIASIVSYVMQESIVDLEKFFACRERNMTVSMTGNISC